MCNLSDGATGRDATLYENRCAYGPRGEGVSKQRGADVRPLFHTDARHEAAKEACVALHVRVGARGRVFVVAQTRRFAHRVIVNQLGCEQVRGYHNALVLLFA